MYTNKKGGGTLLGANGFHLIKLTTNFNSISYKYSPASM